MSRLESVAAGVAYRLREATPTVQREVSFAACEFAVRESMIDDQVALRALAKLRESRDLDQASVQRLGHLLSRLDDEYFDLQEAADADESEEENTVGPSEYLRVFAKARAVSALLAAFEQDPSDAAAEAVYEASVVTDDPQKLFRQIEMILQRPR